MYLPPATICVGPQRDSPNSPGFFAFHMRPGNWIVTIFILGMSLLTRSDWLRDQGLAYCVRIQTLFRVSPPPPPRFISMATRQSCLQPNIWQSHAALEFNDASAHSREALHSSVETGSISGSGAPSFPRQPRPSLASPYHRTGIHSDYSGRSTIAPALLRPER
ncbi:hypothetical protein FIBSPDRAFT_393170 [Athelia psychrophila]|uniref:Uncharacterized protein n=1 Tax=Athelia psychrophila TaxID=1759441 RepID=A0A166NKQ1_9AGAM|nr:hypothetical protein FIBSPDRAFT_393170 [Fibularhizoctonia sp. CBS 109695]